MSIGIDRKQAMELIYKYIQNKRMIYHCLASEAVMQKLALYLGLNAEKWSLTGLLHDLDVELVSDNLVNHGVKTIEILKDFGVKDEEMFAAILTHNDSAAEGIKRTEEFHHALAAAETITGMITATTLVYPDKKIASVKAKSVKKRMKSKAFAASVRRENIYECEKIGLELDDFINLSLKAMQEISDSIGL